MTKSNNVLQLGRALAMAMILPIFLIGCSEDDASGDTSGELIGTWALTEYTSDSSATTSAEGVTITVDADGVAENIDATLTFTADPNEVSSVGSFDFVITSSIAGQTETETVPIDNFASTSTWSREGNTLTFENGEIISVDSSLDLVEPDDNTVAYTIDELTDTILRLRSSITQTVTEQGVEIDITAEVRMVLTRQ